MEQAATGALSSLFAQLGLFGLGLAFVVAAVIWWFRATKDIRDEKEGALGRVTKELAEVKAERDKYQEAYYSCKYPGSRPDPFDEDGEPS